MEVCLWIVFFMLFPDLNMGLLSDYKICGDPECESPMSRVQAVKNHQGKDCRFLNFRRGDTIFVYHKLTGKREDLWAGSIDKQFGYFPKDAVQEEEVFATMRKVLETQESDFFCMDESGYPLDTSHLDTDDDDDLNFQDHEPESSQISPHSHDRNAQVTLMSTESTVKEREDEGGNKALVDATELLEDELKTSAIPEQQGGSPSSSWLRSSMTGWLGFAKEEQSGDSEQEVREDEKKETKSEASLTSSVTGWLGIGGEDNPNNDEDSVKGREDTFTSTMTGWLGFGEEKKTVASENKENEETGHEKEPTEKFRSRRMSLDLEGSKLQEEEKEDMGTMGWLGSGLASRLVFGSSAQDSEGEDVEVKEEQPSSSWMEMGIGGIWGFGGSNTGADESEESGIGEPERDQMLEQPSGFESLDISQPVASFSEETKTETVPYTLPVSAESDDAAEDNIDHSNTEDVNNLDIDAGILNKDDSFHNSSQIDDESIGEHNIRDKQISQNDEFIEQPEISSGSDHSLEKLHSNSMEQLEGSMEESENHDVQIEAPGRLEEEGAEITNQVHKIEGSTLMSENSPVNRDNYIEEHFNKMTAPFQQEILGVQSELPEETQVSGDQEESNEQSQLGSSPHQGEVGLQQETQTQTVEVTSKDDAPLLSGNTESLQDSVSEEGLNETKPNIYMTKESPQIVRDGDVDRFKETVTDQNELTEEETSDSENKVFNGNQIKSTIVSERETEEGFKEEEKVEIDKQEAVKVQEQIEGVKQEELKMKLEGLNKEETEKEEEIGDISEEDMELREERQEEIEELEKLVEELPEYGHQIREEELKESEEQNEKEEKADVSGEYSSQEGMELAEGRQKEMEAEGEKLETVLLEHEQVNVERLKESVEPNEIGQDEEENMSGVFRASSSQEGAELAEERQKEMEEAEEREKSVEESPEHGHRISVDELKELEDENEKEEKVDVFLESSNQEGIELAEERQKEMVELKEGEKWETVLVEHEQIQTERLNESVEPNETEKEEEMSDVSGESSGQEDEALTEERETKMKKLSEEEKQVDELLEHGYQIRVEELKELKEQNENEIADDSEEMEMELKKDEREAEELRNQQIGDVLQGDEDGTLERLEESEEQNKQAEKEVENQVWEGQLEHKQTDMLDNSSLASLVSEMNTQTEIQKDEEQEKEEVEKQNKEELEKESEHPKKEVEDENVEVGGFEDGGRTGTNVNDDGDWKKDRQGNYFEEETRKTYATETENKFHKDREEMHDSAESQVQTSEQTESTEPPQGTDSESRGAFGLIENTFGFFSQKPTPEMPESTKSVHNFNTNEAEPSQPHPSITPELEFPTDSFPAEVTHAAFPTEQPQTRPLSAENLPHSAHLVTKELSKTKPFTKHYKNLLHHMNAEDAVILEDLFGRHKLQFLDYIVKSSEASSAEDDQSILLDIERLLQHNMETLVAPSMSITDAPQEDKQRTSAIIALQKLETLLKTVKETVSTGISDVSNHQAEHSSSQEKEDNSQSASLHKDDDDDDGKHKDLNNEEEERRIEGSKDNIASFHLTQPGSKKKGVMKQTLDFIHRVAEDSINCAQAVLEILVWIHVQVRPKTAFAAPRKKVGVVCLT